LVEKHKYFEEIFRSRLQCSKQRQKFLRKVEKNQIKVKIKQSRKWPGVAQRVPGGLGSQIS
jgi:hypothetical protein